MASTLLETAHCPSCESAGEPRLTQRDLYCGVEGEFGQRYCAACDLFFLSPRVTEAEIGRYYPESYAPWRRRRPAGMLENLAGSFSIPRKRRRMIEGFISGGRILDVGCGAGAFLAALDDKDWQKYGLEIKPADVVPWRGEFFSGRFDESAPPIKDLDAITMWHVFEHLYHPRQALNNAAGMLRPGAFLFLSMPNPYSPERYAFGKYWCGWDPPRHIATYSRRAVESMLAKSGFQLRAVLGDATGVDWCLNLDFLLRSCSIRTELHQSLALRALFSPLAFLANRLRCSGSILYVASK